MVHILAYQGRNKWKHDFLGGVGSVGLIDPQSGRRMHFFTVFLTKTPEALQQH